MTRYHWFCWHHGWANEPKFRLAAARTGRTVAEILGVWAAVMEHASAANERGDVSGLNAELIGLSVGLDTGTVAAVLEQFRDLELIEGKRIAKWELDQNVSNDPTNAKRQQRHRSKSAKSNVTARYVTTQDRTEQDTTEQNIQNRTGKESCVLENVVQGPESPYSADSGGGDSASQVKDDASDLDMRLADIELGDEAVKIVQEQRPGADPDKVLRAFKAWAKREKRHARGWKRPCRPSRRMNVCPTTSVGRSMPPLRTALVRDIPVRALLTTGGVHEVSPSPRKLLTWSGVCPVRDILRQRKRVRRGKQSSTTAIWDFGFHNPQRVLEHNSIIIKTLAAD